MYADMFLIRRYFFGEWKKKSTKRMSSEMCEYLGYVMELCCLKPDIKFAVLSKFWKKLSFYIFFFTHCFVDFYFYCFCFSLLLFWCFHCFVNMRSVILPLLKKTLYVYFSSVFFFFLLKTFWLNVQRKTFRLISSHFFFSEILWTYVNVSVIGWN